MKACIIIHNMVVEHRRDSYESDMGLLVFVEEARKLFDSGATFQWESQSATEEAMGSQLPDGMWASIVASRETRITSSTDHFFLKHDLIEHIWKRHGNF